MLLRVRARFCLRMCFIPIVCLLAHTHSPIRSRTHTFSLTRKHIQTRAGRAARIPGVAWRKGHYWGSRSHWAYGWSGATWYAWSAGPAWRAGVYVLQCVVVWCSMVQCVAVVPQGNLVCLSARPAWHAGAWVLQSVVVCCSVSKCVKVVPLGSGVCFFGKARMVRRWCVCVAGGNSYLAATLDIGDEYSVEIVHSVSRRWSMVFCGNRSCEFGRYIWRR